MANIGEGGNGRRGECAQKHASVSFSLTRRSSPGQQLAEGQGTARILFRLAHHLAENPHSAAKQQHRARDTQFYHASCPATRNSTLIRLGRVRVLSQNKRCRYRFCRSDDRHRRRRSNFMGQDAPRSKQHRYPNHTSPQPRDHGNTPLEGRLINYGQRAPKIRPKRLIL